MTMKALPTQNRALHKRASLIEAAIDQFSAEGFDVATAKTIAETAGVATGTFYQYFENKADILNVIAVQRFDFLREHIEMLELTTVNGDMDSVIDDKFENILRFVYDFHTLAPELHQVLEQRRITDQHLSKIMNDGEMQIKQRVLKFVLDQGVPNAEIVAENLFAMGEGIVHRLVFDSSNSEVDSEATIRIGAQMLASYFKNGIKRGKQI